MYVGFAFAYCEEGQHISKTHSVFLGKFWWSYFGLDETMDRQEEAYMIWLDGSDRNTKSKEIFSNYFKIL